jgi:DNA topoisomerase I
MKQRLYELIWKRAIASQMADAQLEKTNVTIAISNAEQTLSASGRSDQISRLSKSVPGEYR